MSDTAYPVLTTIEQVFKDIVWTPMITLGENWIEAEIPILDLPVIKQVDEAVLEKITDAIYSQICLLIDIGAIQLKDAAMQSAYDASSEKLVVIGEEQGVTSDAYKQAQVDAIAALRSFAQLSGQ